MSCKSRLSSDLMGEEEDGIEYNEGYNDCLSDVRKIITDRIEELEAKSENSTMGEIRNDDIRIRELEELKGNAKVIKDER